MFDVDLEVEVRKAVGASVPGIVVVVVGREGVRARAAVGLADVSSRTQMRIDDGFLWFSMTKIATATTALRLVERRALDLDAPLASLLPVVRRLKPAGWASQITVRHLLQHSGGFANPIPIRWIHPIDQPAPDADAFLERLLRKHSHLRSKPGDRSSYSNLGALALGSAISHAAGAPFQFVVENELLAPWGCRAPALPSRPAALGLPAIILATARCGCFSPAGRSGPQPADG